MAEKYRVAVIGSTGRGNYGHGLDTVWLELAQCEIVGVADPAPEGLKAAAARLKAPKAFADYRKLLDETKPQIVAIGPRWPEARREMMVAAAERGIHVYTEKPLCRTPAEADDIIAACEKTNVKAAIAHQTRYSPKLQVVRDLILDGKLGQILEFRGRGKEDHRGGGEDLWVLGSHVMNIIHHLGGDPISCFARFWNQGEPATKDQIVEGNESLGPILGDQVFASYAMPEGVVATFGSRKNALGNRFGVQIYGSKGVLEILFGHLPEVHFLADPAWSPGRSKASWVAVSSAGAGKPEPLVDGGLHAGNLAACRDLLAAIEEDRLPECNLFEGRMTVEMICAAFESYRIGGPVEFPLKTRVNPLSLWK